MTDGFHPPVEEYLSAIHDLEEDNIDVIQARLAERLGHAPPTVHEMVKRLRDSGYVSISGRTIHLTESGRHQAQAVVRKHRLAERLLTDVIGLAWHKAHSEAARWEHVISDEVADRLQTILENPRTCPHGNPIPGAQHQDQALVTLASLALGERFILRRVPEQIEFDSTALALLGENGFVTDTEAQVLSQGEDAVEVTYGTQTLALPHPLPALLLVETRE